MKNYNKLIVIGNGFDIDHGLKTSYKDILNGNEALKTMKEMSEKMGTVIDYSEREGNQYEDIIRQTVLAGRGVGREPNELLPEISNKWMDLNQDFKKFVEYVHEQKIKRENGKDAPEQWDEYRIYKEYTKALIYVIRNGIIKAIEGKNISLKESYKDYFSSGAKVINFNYTTLLEKDGDVLHVHGKIKQGSTLTDVNREVGEEESISSDMIRVGYSSLDINNEIVGDVKIELIANEGFDEEETLELLNYFEEYIGNKSLYLNKTAFNDWGEEAKGIRLSDGYELIFLGHSLNNIDMKLLEGYIFDNQEVRTSKITIVTYLEDKNKKNETLSKACELSRKFECDVHIKDNGDNFGDFNLTKDECL